MISDSQTPPEMRAVKTQNGWGHYLQRIYVIAFIISIAIVFFAPQPFSTITFWGLVILSIVTLAQRSTRFRRLPALSKRSAVMGAEIAIILVCALVFTHKLQDWSPNNSVQGAEFSYLINSGVIASTVYQRSGSIPLWNPFMGSGEPLLENPFSFVLNPLMTLPILGFGIMQGPKVAILLHIALMGLGGWTLGYAIGLRGSGRLLLGLLLTGSGSMAGAIDLGFYQMGLSQTYMPWVFAGLLGTLHRKERWPVGLLALASTLLIFSGTFWYVLPTAIGAVMVTLFAVVERDTHSRRLKLNIFALRRLLLATVLTIGLAAVRLVPQIAHYDLVSHPAENLTGNAIDFLVILRMYFSSSLQPGFGNTAVDYHYILPPLFIVFFVAAFWLRMWGKIAESRWRIIAPALILIFQFTTWAQAATPVLIWLYTNIPLFAQWRFVGRVLAASAIWVAVIAAICFDDVTGFLARSNRLREGFILLVVLLVGAVGAVDVLNNWTRLTGVVSLSDTDRSMYQFLRIRHPSEFLPVFTQSFYSYYPLYETLERASFGNPDYKPGNLPFTIGTWEMMAFAPTYAVGYANTIFYLIDPVKSGYMTVPGTVELYGNAVIWENPTSPTYVFTAQRSDLTDRLAPLTREVTTPIFNYTHYIDSVHVRLQAGEAGRVLVVGETAYPGWEVGVNGESAPLESVGGLMGVTLPDQPVDTLNIIFSYRPYWLYVGGVITLISALVFAAHLLRLDRVIRVGQS